MSNKHICIIIIFLIVANVAAFGRIVTNDFIKLDDDLYILNNDNIKYGFTLKSIKWAFTSDFFWHPLTWFSHILDWQLFGANAFGHHLTSLILHIGAVVLLFLFFNKTTNRLWLSAFVAAFFALHPLRVESVAWIAERKDVLSMFWGVACLYSYAFYCLNLKRSNYLLCLVIFALALMSKSTMVTLPFVMLLLDYWPMKRLTGETVGKVIREKVPLFFFTIFSCMITISGQNKAGAIPSLDQLSITTRLSNAVVSYVSYLEKFFVPIDLAVFYPYDVNLPHWKVICSCIVLLIIMVPAVIYKKQLPFLFVGWFWFLGTLVPLIGLIQAGSQAMADRYTYFSSIGISIILVWGPFTLFRNRRVGKKILFVAGFLFLTVLSVLTWQQCGYWKNSATLFCHTAQVTKNNDFAHTLCGLSLLADGKIGEAISHLDESIRLYPKSAESYYYKGIAFSSLNRNEEAINEFNNALKLETNKQIIASIYKRRGTAYAKLKSFPFAIDDLNKAIMLRNKYTAAYLERANVYLCMGKYKQAVKDYNFVIQLKPDNALGYNNRSLAYLNQGNIELACKDAKTACKLGACSTLETVRKLGICN
jgi:tetratricopeptide (TPR) repeat protein